jgi:hypothetical protein
MNAKKLVRQSSVLLLMAAGWVLIDSTPGLAQNPLIYPEKESKLLFSRVDQALKRSSPNSPGAFPFASTKADMGNLAVSYEQAEESQPDPAQGELVPQDAEAPRAVPFTPPGQEFSPISTSAEADAAQGYFGLFAPGGRGFKLANTKYGEVNFSAWTYVRYLNQHGLEHDYTDSFGRTRELNLREDVQLNKVNLYFKGWVYDERLQYLLYAWTANTSQGDPAQVVIAGALSWVFDEKLTLSGGIGPLPGTRTLRGTFPYWLKVDTRPLADEFFRPSYTSGFWASGKLAEGLYYKAMVGNNLSQLGVNASKLPGAIGTYSGAVWWMPTTGEFGPAAGYGDFEDHQQLATLIGLNMTHSREDKQSQPGTEAINNSQIRLSDGTIVFTPGAFGTDGAITRLTYNMVSTDAALKYQGFALEGEYYFRWLGDFRTVGDVPVTSLFDNGFQVQISQMICPKMVQAYVAGSYVFGQYGDPWDVAVGINWFPLKERLFRVNTELLYLNRSPVGYNSIPAVVGGKGLVFYSNVELVF